MSREQQYMASRARGAQSEEVRFHGCCGGGNAESEAAADDLMAADKEIFGTDEFDWSYTQRVNHTSDP